MLREAYEGARVCVTGGAGFVGVQLVRQLLELGATVYVMDNMSRGSNIVDGAHYITGDATDIKSCLFAFRGESASSRGRAVDYVFNLAADVAGVLHNAKYGVQMFAANASLQTIPLIAAEEAGIQNFVQISSVCVYSPIHQIFAVEENGMVDEPHISNYGYAWAKRMGEKMALLSGIERVVIARPTNMYGPYDYYDETAHVIPALIRKAIENEHIELLGNPTVVREFLHTSDGARGMLHIGAFGEDREAYNIHAGEMNQISIMNLAEMIRKHVGVPEKEIVANESFSGGDPIRRIEGKKISLLGYAPKMPIDLGIQEVVEWTKKNVLN